MDWHTSLNGTAGDLLGTAREGGRFATGDHLSRPTWALPEQIANTLVEDIIQGTLGPGERLHEVALASRFGVSRGPVREALRIVEKEGLIQIRPRYGSFVAKLSAAEAQDIFEVRSLLLSLAARRLAEHKSDTVVAFLREGTRRLDATIDDAEQFLAVVYRCSMYVTEQADNALARSILVSLARRTLYLTRVVMLRPESRRLWAKGWRAMECAATRDQPAEAEAAMRDIVATVCASVLALVEQDDG